MYEVNANGNRSYKNSSAAKVADVACEWRKQGHSPSAFAIRERDGKIAVAEVAVTTKAATAKALAGAK